MLSHIGLACVTFIVTNVDDLLILSIYFASPKYKTKNIVAGQYLGITALVLISLSGVLLGEVIDQRWISLLGILPILLGIRDLVKKSADDSDDEIQKDKSTFQFLNVALVTIANGGDNIGVYTPLFANIKSEYILIYCMIFIALTAIWCFLGFWFVSHPRVKLIFSRYGKVILPFFLILLGLFIIKDFFS